MSSTPEPNPRREGTGPEATGRGDAGPGIPVVEIPVPTRETELLARIQRTLLDVPGALTGARTLSHVGEHALGWMAVAALGAVADPPRRGRWAMVGVGTFGAHAASVLVKRVVRRRRPEHPTVRVGVDTPSRLSFPSSHATSTTTFALLAGAVSGVPVAPALVPVMLASRLALGVHYPTDVLAGAALGGGCAAATRALWPAAGVQRMLPAALRDAAGTPTVTTQETR